MDTFAPLASYIKGPEQRTPEHQQQEALIEALRSGMGSQQQAAPTQAGNVVSANANGSGYASGAQLGSQLGKLGQGLNDQYGLTTALKYGTNPGSQQTMMLAGQNAGF